jgi:hypothetical protein
MRVAAIPETKDRARASSDCPVGASRTVLQEAALPVLMAR